MKPFKIISISVLILLFSCQKDRKVGSKLENFFSGGHSKKSSSIQSNVSYNSTHDVLVFATKQDVDLLEEELEIISSEIYNRGNSDVIFQTLEDIKTYGYTNGNGNSGDKVKIKDFEIVLEQSNPLSDSVLSEILNVNDNYRKLPPPFIRDVFIDNTQLSSSILNQLDNSQVPNGIINQIKSADDNDVVGKNYAYEEFLSRFPAYNSLYEKLLEEERTDLENGVSPFSEEFDDDIVQEDFLRLILNSRKEVYIGKNLYKIYSDCKWVNMQEANIDNAFQDLGKLDEEGTPQFPVGLTNDDSGIPEDEMGQYIPLGYSQFDPNFADDDGNGNITSTMTGVSQELASNCPPSEFYYNIDIVGNDFRVDFHNQTDNFNSQINEYYQYWTFGDGTGSFEEDPSHIYTDGYGPFTVKLYTFTPDCGCWDVEYRVIEIPRPKTDCSAVISYNETTEELSADVYGLDPLDSPEKYYWTIYADNPCGADGPVPLSNHNFVMKTIDTYDISSLPQGTYYAKVLVKTFDKSTCETKVDCEIMQTAYIFTTGGMIDPTDENSCCDRRDKVNLDFESNSFGGKTTKIKFTNRAIGNPFLFFKPRIIGEIKFYTQKSNGNWKKTKFDNSIIKFEGQLYFDGESRCSDQINVDPTSGSTSYAYSPVLSFVDSKNSSKHHKFKISYLNNKKFGLQKESLIVKHTITFNGETKYITSLLGDPDCE